QQRYPDNPYQTELAGFKTQYQSYLDERAAARTSKLAGPMTEAQWFFHDALRKRQIGDEAGARRTWRQLVDAFGPVRSERPWVRRAQEELDRLPGETNVDRNLAPLSDAVARVEEMRANGKVDEADATRKALGELYKGDKGAEPVLKGNDADAKLRR